MNTLVLLGAFCGAAGSAFVATGPVRTLERVLAIVAGAFMVVVALEMLGGGAGISARLGSTVQSLLRRLLGGAIGSGSVAAPLALGVFNAFLPCQLIYAFAARAASTASVGEGMLTMLAFGAGTVPAMLALGTVWAFLAPHVRARLSFVSALVVLALAAATLFRGFLPGHVH